MGYGMVRWFDAAEVRAIASALERLTPEAMVERFDHERMTELEIYPSVWDEDEAEEVLEVYGQLRSFLQKGAQRGVGLLVYLN